MATSDWTESLIFIYGNQKHRWERNFWTYITFLVSLASDWKTASVDSTACMVVSFLKKKIGLPLSKVGVDKVDILKKMAFSQKKSQKSFRAHLVHMLSWDTTKKINFTLDTFKPKY